MRHYFAAGLAYLGVTLASAAQATCPQGQDLFTSCQIEGRNTEVVICSDNHVVNYRYGPIGGAPDLVLSQPIPQVGFEPWSGVGKEIAESVTFYNDAYGYNVYGGFSRPFSEEDMLLDTRHFGGINITKNGTSVTTLKCIPQTVSYGYPSSIYDAKMAAGLVWDDRARIWLYDPNHPATPYTGAPMLMKEPPARGADDCLPSSEFKLGGIMMGDTANTLDEQGTPDVIEMAMGGFLEIERSSFDGLRVDTHQDKVMGLQVTAPHWETPSGLRVGLPRADVALMLGHAPNGQEVTSKIYSVSVCMGDQDDFAKWYAAFAFGHDNRVQSIDFASFSP